MTVPPEVTYVVDTSAFQGNVNFQAVSAVCGGAWAKVSEGTGYEDPYWPNDKAGMLAEEARIVGGGYLFLHEGDGAGQADYFAELAGDLTGLGIFIDGEPVPKFGSYPQRSDVMAAAARLREDYPTHKIGGYLPKWYWGQMPFAGVVDWMFASEYTFGEGTPEQLYQQVPGYFWDSYGGLPVEVLQFSSSAVIPGVSGLVDVSAFRGDQAAYRELVLGGPPPHVPVWPYAATDYFGAKHHNGYAGGRAQQVVATWQRQLNADGFRVAADGLFGPATEAQCKAFQSASGLVVDGLVGPRTWAATWSA
jgi:lysozyme